MRLEMWWNLVPIPAIWRGAPGQNPVGTRSKQIRDELETSLTVPAIWWRFPIMTWWNEVGNVVEISFTVQAIWKAHPVKNPVGTRSKADLCRG
jgi:hypothetical protein